MTSGEPLPGVTPLASMTTGSAPATAAPELVTPAADGQGTAARPKPRVDSIDLARGLVMVLMALDHTRDYFHPGGFNPTDLSKVSVALFLTRLVTHLCAPTFVFLAGTSAALSALGGASRASQSGHLVLRGSLLILLELTLVKWGWSFELNYQFVGLLVIWALGWSMIALAALIWLPRWAILAVGGGMVLLHNLTDSWGRDGSPLPDWLWTVLHVQAPIDAGRFTLYVAYPLIPWIGVMALGYVFGGWLGASSDARRRRCLWLGAACLVAFILLRASNLYGDPAPWEAPEGRSGLWIFTALAFVNTTKYPPSLLYLLMTLGSMFFLLAAFEGWRSARESASLVVRRRSMVETIRHALLVFGRVPLFFYLLHIPLIHGLAIVNVLVRVGPPPPGARQWGQDALYDLPGVYAVWIVVILILYPLCGRYDAYKRRRRGGWTRYL